MGNETVWFENWVGAAESRLREENIRFDLVVSLFKTNGFTTVVYECDGVEYSVGFWGM